MFYTYFFPETHQVVSLVDFVKTEICGQKCDFEHSVIGTE